eukprot:TRINITY_DN787_c7_g1_i1.p1 TRINITY_DN787_c7_g1~~TRINITY_DN787_c7_g1_i1.p1  ORF type:complete len:111 (-),score=15.51 TRINITY_DN787_c7_g1_i1:169-501(-)
MLLVIALKASHYSQTQIEHSRTTMRRSHYFCVGSIWRRDSFMLWLQAFYHGIQTKTEKSEDWMPKWRNVPAKASPSGMELLATINQIKKRKCCRIGEEEEEEEENNFSSW